MWDHLFVTSQNHIPKAVKKILNSPLTPKHRAEQFLNNFYASGYMGFTVSVNIMLIGNK